VWAGEVEKARAQRTHWLVALLAEAADGSIFFGAAGDVLLVLVLGDGDAPSHSLLFTRGGAEMFRAKTKRNEGEWQCKQ
jgi:hypothetical protein